MRANLFSKKSTDEETMTNFTIDVDHITPLMQKQQLKNYIYADKRLLELTTLSVSLSRCSVVMTLAMIALFVIITPLGSPVVPLVYMIVQISSFCFLGCS